MSSQFLFPLRRFSSIAIVGRGFGSHAVYHAVKGAMQSTSSGINSGLLINVLPLYYHRLPDVGSRTITYDQTRTQAASSNEITDLYLNIELYITNLEAMKAAQLRRWGTWSSLRSIRRSQINQHFGLRYVFRVFDKLLFRGLLDGCVKLEWVETPTENLGWLSRNSMISDAKRGPYVFIQIVKPAATGTWTHATLQERLEAMLFEMTQVFFVIYIQNGIPFQRPGYRAASGRQSGDGILFENLLQGVKQEADRTLIGFSRPWQVRSRHK